MTSLLPPGGNGTTIWIGEVGQAGFAKEVTGMLINATIARQQIDNRRRIMAKLQ
jgi:hypothetical protein